jgi:hypothetical protein
MMLCIDGFGGSASGKIDDQGRRQRRQVHRYTAGDRHLRSALRRRRCRGPRSRSSAGPGAPDDWNEDDDPEVAKRRYLLRRFWHSAGRFWLKSGDRLAWPLSAAVLALILVNLAFQYGINVWNRVIFDALEKRDSGTVFFLSAIFVS